MSSKPVAPSPGDKRLRNLLLGILFLAIVSGALFGLSIRQRAGYFDEMDVSMSGWLTGGTVLGARNWYRESPFKLGFALFWTPDSIETPNIASRERYLSIPSGCILPVYLISKLRGRQADAALARNYNLFIQAGIAFLLGVIVFLVALRLRFSLLPAWLLGVIPVVLYLWLPGPYYEHVKAYFSDQAVMFPFALYIFFETLRWQNNDDPFKRQLARFQALIALYGTFTDWLFVFVVFCAYLTRFFRGEFGRKPIPFIMRSLLFWMPVALAIFFIGVQLYHFGAFDEILKRFLYRTGVQADITQKTIESGNATRSWLKLLLPEWRNLYWRSHFPGAYGKWGIALLLFSMTAFAALLAAALCLRIRNKSIPLWISLPACLLTLSLLPCILYYQVFKSHSAFIFHSFAALKFALPLALFPFAVLPAALFAAAWRNPLVTRRRRVAETLLSLMLLFSAMLLVLSLKEAREKKFGAMPTDHVPIAKFIGEHTGYNDVVFSSDYEIKDRPPQVIVYSMKQAYKVASIQDIRTRLESVSGPYTVNFFARKALTHYEGEGIDALIERAYQRIRQNGMELYKIRKEDFLAFCNSLNTAPPAEKATK